MMKTTGAGINVLLVHGAFVDASSWGRVIPLLQREGFHVLAVQNPNTSLANDITTTSQALASLSGPTILVGHSYGGAVTSNVQASNVSALVYIAAYAPDEGESVFDLNGKFPATPALDPASGRLAAGIRRGSGSVSSARLRPLLPAPGRCRGAVPAGGSSGSPASRVPRPGTAGPCEREHPAVP